MRFEEKFSKFNLKLNLFPLLGPGDIASVPTKSYSHKTSQSNENELLCQNSPAKQMARSIEEYDELQDYETLNALDSRKRPEYSISYKQSVTPQDVYLQVHIFRPILNW